MENISRYNSAKVSVKKRGCVSDPTPCEDQRKQWSNSLCQISKEIKPGTTSAQICCTLPIRSFFLTFSFCFFFQLILFIYLFSSLAVSPFCNFLIFLFLHFLHISFPSILLIFPAFSSFFFSCIFFIFTFLHLYFKQKFIFSYWWFIYYYLHSLHFAMSYLHAFSSISFFQQHFYFSLLDFSSFFFSFLAFSPSLIFLNLFLQFIHLYLIPLAAL